MAWNWLIPQTFCGQGYGLSLELAYLPCAGGGDIKTIAVLALSRSPQLTQELGHVGQLSADQGHQTPREGYL